VQEGGVFIDLLGVAIDLQVAQQMSYDVSKEDHTGHGHDGLFPDGGCIEADDPMHGIDRNSTHAEILCLMQAVGRDARNSDVDFKLVV
jgi:hypothetical protein